MNIAAFAELRREPSAGGRFVKLLMGERDLVALAPARYAASNATRSMSVASSASAFALLSPFRK